ncbi:MAG TPA: ATP-binding protein [Vicinamibacterales bacterium]|nr:ATP-binding protein [Vicinamibacterales bacterium]
MTPSGYALIGLTALVAALVGVLAFAVMRFAAATRDLRRQARDGDAAGFVASALEDAIRKLRDQERLLTARAERSERLNTEIVSSLTSGLLVVDLRGMVRMVNPAARRLLRLGSVQPGQSFRSLLEDAAPLAAVIEECLSSARPAVRRSVTLRRAAAAVHLGVTVSPLLDEEGTLQGAVCLFSDLTAVMELEERVRLKDSLARLGELTAGLAHEFRNGLATIHGYARLLDPAKPPDHQRTYVEAIRAETDSLERIVFNFLNFARPAQLTLGPLQSAHLVEHARAELDGEAKAHGGEIAVRGEFGTIDGDEVLLAQALVNLVRNAVQSCVEAGRAPRVTIEGRVDVPNHALRLRVSDNGPGIPEAARDKLFQPFFTTRARGTGLGLALVQKIVVSHNGRVEVETPEGGGAAFTLLLPLTTPG